MTQGLEKLSSFPNLKRRLPFKGSLLLIIDFGIKIPPQYFWGFTPFHV
jgi:hypothetical protein